MITYRELLTGLKGHEGFGWFRAALEDSRVKDSIDKALGIIKDVSSLAGSYGIGLGAAASAARRLLPDETSDIVKLRSAFLAVFRSLSDSLRRENRFLAVLLDDTQFSSGPDFQLIKDLIQNLHSIPGIILIIAFRLQEESERKYAELQAEISRFGYN